MVITAISDDINPSWSKPDIPSSVSEICQAGRRKGMLGERLNKQVGKGKKRLNPALRPPYCRLYSRRAYDQKGWSICQLVEKWNPSRNYTRLSRLNIDEPAQFAGQLAQ